MKNGFGLTNGKKRKALDGLVNYYKEKGVIRFNTELLERIIFGLSGGIIFFCTVLEPFNLRPSYWRFLHTISNGRYNQFEPLAR
jgi:hypothetical protein